MTILSCGAMISDATKDPSPEPESSDGSTLFSIKGTFTNTQDSTACALNLSGAGVTKQTICAPDGTYLFKDLPSGSYTVTATVSTGLVFPDHYDCVIGNSDITSRDFAFSRSSWSMTGTTAGASLVSVVEDSGYVALGFTPVSGKMNDICFTKYAYNGDVVWQKTLGGTGDDEGVKIRLAADGGYYLLCNSVAYTSTLAGMNGRLIKIDVNGNVLWDTTFGGLAYDCVSDFIILSEGSAVICGSSKSFSANGDSDFYTVKIDNTGAIVWSKTYGTSQDEYGISIAAISDTAYILAGYTNGSDGSSSRIILKTIDASGNETASKVLDATTDEYPTAMVSLVGNNFAIASNAVNSFSSRSDAQVIIVDGSLNLVSRTVYGSVGNSGFTSVASDGAGGFYAAGYLCKATGWKDKDFYLVKILSDGTNPWETTDNGIITKGKVYGDGSEETVLSVVVTTHGVILAGSSVVNNQSYVKVVSVDASGVIPQ